jgi:hypothetical protein
MTDRQMTPELAAALDALTPAQRRVLPALAVESEHDWLAALLLGLAAEVPRLQRRDDVARIRADIVFHDLEVDMQADVDKLAEGADWSHVPAPAPRTVAWWPEAAPDTIEGLDTPCP